MSEAAPHLEPSSALVGDKGLSATRSATSRTWSSASLRPHRRTRSRRRSASSSPCPASGARAGGAAGVVRADVSDRAGLKYLNRADPDCGTTFAWTTRAFGPWVGWMNGWAIFVADVIVMASLAVIAAQYTFLLFGWHSAAHSTAGILIGSVVWIAAHDLDLLPRHRALRPRAVLPARAEIAILGLFAMVALVKVYGEQRRPARCTRRWSGSTRSRSCSARSSTACCSASSSTGAGTRACRSTRSPRDSAEAPGQGGRHLDADPARCIYLVVSTAAQAYAGTAFLANNSRRRSERRSARRCSAPPGTSS